MQNGRGVVGALLLAFLFLAENARADAPVAKVEVFPPDVELSTSRDRQKFIVVATRADGVTLDVTGQSQAKLANPALAKLDGSTLYPIADGQTTLE
ncbi:MAG: cell surface protein, partial [Pirellulales bacterium]